MTFGVFPVNFCRQWTQPGSFSTKELLTVLSTLLIDGRKWYVLRLFLDYRRKNDVLERAR